jgi:2-keto-3-deoxy-L-rhamnonate aldolase RhmA
MLPRKNTLKEKLRRKELTIGSWLTIGNEITAELMARQRFDWLVIDIEHSAIDLSMTQNMVRIIELSGCVPLVRVGDNDPALIKRVMDMGAHGVIVPMVNSVEEAKKAVAAVKYPPLGTRGVGLARAQGYGTQFENYKKWVNKDSIVIVQIEHVNAVRNFEKIVTTEGVDAFIVGPYDLSGSLGYPGNFTHPLVKENLNKVISQSKKLKINAGIHVIPPDYREVNKRIKEGYRFIALSLDTLLLARFTEDSLAKIQR